MNRFWIGCAALLLSTASYPANAEDSVPGKDPATSEARPDKIEFPRVGDSLEELTARHGPGKENAGKIRMPGNDEYYWEIADLGINVVMQDGHAVMLVAHGLHHKITEADITRLLAANSRGKGWHPESRPPQWLRNDHELQAFRQKSHTDMFFLQNIAIIAKSGDGAIPGGR